MKRPKRLAHETVANLIRSITPHPRRHDFVEAAIRLLAEDVRDAATDGSLTEDEAMDGARKEFETGLAGLVFSAAEDRFYVFWTFPHWSPLLRPYLLKAWEQEPGAYGSRPPKTYDPKRNPFTLN